MQVVACSNSDQHADEGEKNLFAIRMKEGPKQLFVISMRVIFSNEDIVRFATPSPLLLMEFLRLYVSPPKVMVAYGLCDKCIGPLDQMLLQSGDDLE